MQGEYRGDFTRDTFWRANHFCQVLMQQGRVQLDADWNEQSAILLHFLRSLARDVIGLPWWALAMGSRLKDNREDYRRS